MKLTRSFQAILNYPTRWRYVKASFHYVKTNDKKQLRYMKEALYNAAAMTLFFFAMTTAMTLQCYCYDSFLLCIRRYFHY